MKKEIKEKLESQHYGFAGKHTAVKICTWTKKSLRDEGVCYKQKFYGIKSHRCCQMSPSVNFCQNNCVFCWRTQEDTEGFKEMTKEQADNPKEIIDKCIEAQRKLLTGFGGNPKTNIEKFKEAQNPNQFAISLTGEPTLYPYLSELISELHKRNNTTFLVSNGQSPDVLERIEPPTQLYISLDAPNKKTFLSIDRPKLKDGWERLNKSLEVMNQLAQKTRTVIRITLIKGLNDIEPENYAKLIEKANPHFVEVKAYMFVGASRQRLSLKNMPYHSYVKEFSERITRHCNYKIIDEKEESRVVLLGENKPRISPKIDFSSSH